MENILVVASSEKTRGLLWELLREVSQGDIIMAKSGNEARRITMGQEFECTIINAPLNDETGCDLSILISQQTSSGVLLIVKAEEADEIAYKVEEYGVFVIPKPISRNLFYQAIKLIGASRKRIRTLQSENIKLQKKIEAIRLVNQAKCALIQYLNMSEEEAHRYIEKQAMDRRMTREEIARGILRTYEMGC